MTSPVSFGQSILTAWRFFVFAVAFLAVGEVGIPAAGTTNLVAAYGFEEGSGTAVADLSGRGNTGTIGLATWTTGRFGRALESAGLDVLMAVNDSDSLHLSDGMTLEAWVYPMAESGGWRDIIYKGLDDTYYLDTLDGVPATRGTFAHDSLFGPTALPPGVWSHLAATYDGVTLSLFVDGVLVASRPQSGLIETSTGALTIGGDYLYGQHWAGRIDEVRIYNRALSGSEIQSDMNTPISPPPLDPTPPVVALSAPGQGWTISQVAAMSAVATDNLAVASVDFMVDGKSVGADVNPPYTIYWNSTTATNGPHTLTAVARDTAGNQATSAPVVVTVVNPAFANETVVPGIVSATTLAFLPDGRMLVGELTETVWVVQPGASSPEPVPFLQLDGSLLFGEQGLMDIILDPGFSTNGYYYIFYTRGFADQDNRNRVSRFTAIGNGTIAGSEVVLWQDAVAAESEHHGGSIAFGSDGKLYISLGDQFNAEDAQRLDSYHGKLLRINSDGSMPVDNPFFDGDGTNLDEIWALGLRNPFRISVDSVTGRMFIGDVGGNDFDTAVEEINLGARGANYGWPLYEGVSGDPAMMDPLYSYRHFGRDACVVGGFVYRGNQFPDEYRGSYFFGDYVQNWIKRLTFDARENLEGVADFEPPSGEPDGPYGDPVKLVEGPDGALYYVDIGFNDAHVPNPAAIRRIRYVAGNRPPIATASAHPTTGLPPLEVAFSSLGSSDPEGAAISYSWSFGDGVTSTEANPTHTFATAGAYTARLTVSDGVSATLSGDLGITVGNPPTASILYPADGSVFRAGDAIQFGGSATDPEDGALTASAFAWTIVFHHKNHLHPAGGVTNATGGVLPIPVAGHDFTGETSYEIILTVTDSDGLKSGASVTVFPDKANVLFDSLPPGLAVDIDGIRKFTPFVLDDAIGFQHVVSAPHQLSGTTNFYFQAWSDAGAQSHTVIIPPTDDTVIATFGLAAPPLEVSSSSWRSNSFQLTFGSLPNRLYRVEWSRTLAPANWVTLAESVVGTGLPISIEDPTAVDELQKFYRVTLLPLAGSSGPPGFLSAAEAHDTGVAALSIRLLSEGDNRAMVVALCWYDELNRDVSSLTYAGEACLPLIITNWFNESGGLALYFLPGPVAGSNTLQVTMSGMTAELCMAAMMITNVNQLDAVGPVAGSYSSSTRDSVAINVGSKVNDLVVDVIGFYTGDLLPGLGQTLRILADNNGNASVMMSTKTGDVSLATMSWSSDPPTQVSEVGVSLHGF